MEGQERERTNSRSTGAPNLNQFPNKQSANSTHNRSMTFIMSWTMNRQIKTYLIPVDLMRQVFSVNLTEVNAAFFPLTSSQM